MNLLCFSKSRNSVEVVKSQNLSQGGFGTIHRHFWAQWLHNLKWACCVCRVSAALWTSTNTSDSLYNWFWINFRSCTFRNPSQLPIFFSKSAYSYVIEVLLKMIIYEIGVMGGRDVSVLKSIVGSSRTPEINSQQSHADSQLSTTVAPVTQ